MTAAYELATSGVEVDVALFEASARLGGTVETVCEQGFVIECGPDGWVTEKPWARQLADRLGLTDELIPSNDATRKTYIVKDHQLVAMPDGMRMMVPGDIDALMASPLFSDQGKQSFLDEIGRAAELKAAAPPVDESVASFVRRHFGDEVLDTVGAPLLSGVFGGDVTTLSVRAVMAPFVAMERQFGSLITAVQARERTGTAPIFTTLRSGLETLIKAMVKQIPPAWLQRETAVTSLEKTTAGWIVGTASGTSDFDAVFLATPAHVALKLLHDTDPLCSALMAMDASSAIIIAFALTDPIDLPPGFGFLVPPPPHEAPEDLLLAGTFVDQKFDSRVPEGGRMIRAFFGGDTGARLMDVPDDTIIALARTQLEALLGHLPDPVVTVVRRWPLSLPQYGVGHLERMAELSTRIDALGNLWLLGNGYRGVGLPDLVRDAQSAVVNYLGKS